MGVPASAAVEANRAYPGSGVCAVCLFLFQLLEEVGRDEHFPGAGAEGDPRRVFAVKITAAGKGQAVLRGQLGDEFSFSRTE